MKAIWTGEIAFGMVSIPISLYAAIRPEEMPTHLLHKKCHTRLKYQRWCPKCNTEVPWEKVVKGYEYSKDKYFIMEPEELKKLSPKRTTTIDIENFIDYGHIDPIYIHSHYYVIPERAKEKAYFLFKEALQTTRKMAIGRFVLKNKEAICTIEDYKSGLLLTTLNYAYEIRDIKEIEVLKEKPRLTDKEKNLAIELINKLTAEKFSVERFEESFSAEIKELIKKQMQGHAIAAEKKPQKKKLMEALRASIQ